MHNSIAKEILIFFKRNFKNNKSDNSSDTEKVQGKTQHLGTDTFVKFLENDIEPSTYKSSNTIYSTI